MGNSKKEGMVGKHWEPSGKKFSRVYISRENGDRKARNRYDDRSHDRSYRMALANDAQPWGTG